ASAPDDAIIIRFKTAHPEGFDATISLSRPKDKGFPTSVTKTLSNNQLEMRGKITQRDGQLDSKPLEILHGVQFRTILVAEGSSGKITASNGSIQVKGASEFTIKLVSATSFYHEDYEQKAEKMLAQVQGKSWEDLLNTHVK